jgi:hypothetical protein
LLGRCTYRAFAKKIEQVLAKHEQMERKAVEVMSNQDSANRAMAALERQLIAERHQSALLYATLPYMADQLAEQTIIILGRRIKARIRRFLPLVAVLVLAGIAIIILYWLK